MPRSVYFILMGLGSLLLTACGELPPEKPSSRNYAPSAGPATQRAEAATLSRQLRAQVERWRGVPYRLGGLDRSGIDCSGFVYHTFRELLDITLPRSTRRQAQRGIQISVRELGVGDLVFFQTGSKVRHVGIYTGQGRFVHASTSEGVTESRLDNPYWSQHYWKARRILTR